MQKKARAIFAFMIRLLTIAVLFFTLCSFGPGETRWMTLSGRVVDANTGNAIIGAKVVLPQQNAVAYTDPDGNFEIAAPVDNETELMVEYISYKDVKVQAQGLSNDHIIELIPQ